MFYDLCVCVYTYIYIYTYIRTYMYVCVRVRFVDYKLYIKRCCACCSCVGSLFSDFSFPSYMGLDNKVELGGLQGFTVL